MIGKRMSQPPSGPGQAMIAVRQGDGKRIDLLATSSHADVRGGRCRHALGDGSASAETWARLIRSRCAVERPLATRKTPLVTVQISATSPKIRKPRMLTHSSCV